MSTIADNLNTLTEFIRAAELRYHRPPHSVSLLAVSKGQPASAIELAYAAGQTAFGENYVQEALDKMAELHAYPIEWHFIGRIQHNKTRKIAEHFHWVHSVSDIATAERLNQQRPTHLPPLNICLQLNLNQETTKSGLCSTENLLSLVLACTKLPNLRLRGLMTIPEPTIFFEKSRENYKKIRLIAEGLHEKGCLLDTLSMGMSQDLEAAIAEGSTLVRIGTKIFGERRKNPK